MTRILQIRRGTSAQNNNFTGLPGELSFDTQDKILRVHDGQTLGGFALARADQIPAGGGGGAGSDFDISSVPAEFWQGIIAAYAPARMQVMLSGLSAIGNVSYIEYVLNLSAPAKFAQCFLVCQTPEAGYSIGDVVAAFGIGARANPLPNTFSDSDGLHVRLMVGGENFWVSHKTDGATAQITNSKWKARFAVYCQ
ncbi:MAG: hypothetical protein LBD50_00580 [Rickettsiales bacterium]|jgi:hypothetical protein|nr:hypothetical protein [Rickettsiales bacterium]